MSLGFYKKKKTNIALMMLILLCMIYAIMGSDAHPYDLLLFSNLGVTL